MPPKFCSGCRALRAQVARLEGELAEAKAMLSDNPDHSDLDAAAFEINRLAGHIAAKDAALRLEIQKCVSCFGEGTITEYPPQGERTFPCWRCRDMRAALSDTGKGWPEPVRQAEWSLRFADAFYQRVTTATLNWNGLEEMRHFEKLFAGLREEAQRLQEINCAALDALKGE